MEKNASGFPIVSDLATLKAVAKSGFKNVHLKTDKKDISICSTEQALDILTGGGGEEEDSKTDVETPKSLYERIEAALKKAKS